MLRVLTLSTLFPSAASPALAPFVLRQTLGLAAEPGVAVEVVAPVGLPLWPLSRHPHYAARADLPLEEEYRGLRVHRPRFRVWPKIGEARTAAAMAEALLPLLRSIRARFPFDVIDAEFFWPDGPAAAILARELGIPFSIKARGSDIHHWARRPGIAGQIVEAGRAADGLLAVSSRLKDEMVALGLPADRIRVHHNGVDLALFAPLDRSDAKRRLGIAGPLIVTIGTLIRRKGQHLAIEALRHLPGATLILIGEGPDRALLERQSVEAGLGGRVRFLGSIPQAEIPLHLAAADLMLLPTAREGLANVWLESLACGTPVVTTDVGGSREVFDRPAAGALVPLDRDSIVAAVRGILDHPPAQAAVRETAERFRWEANSSALAAHLGALAGRRLRAA
jgi:teichuronic acid biosynthesis glycosyltransferase TuaC